MTSKTTILNFRVDSEEYAHLEDMAREKNYGVAEMARACLREGLQKAHTFEPKPADIAVRPRRVPGARQGPGVLTGATPVPTA